MKPNTPTSSVRVKPIGSVDLTHGPLHSRVMSIWPFSRSRRTPDRPTETPEASTPRGVFSTDIPRVAANTRALSSFNRDIIATQHATAMDAASQAATVAGVAMDDSTGIPPQFKTAVVEMPAALLGWYASQRFIGYQTCAMIAQHWLVDKACSMPGRDAVRHGFEIQAYGDSDGTVLDTEQKTDITERIKRADRRYKLFRNLTEFVRMGRLFGIRVAFFKVKSDDPKYYELPFNPDGITPGSYEGIVQVDPYWCIPLLSGTAASDPMSVHFYEPEWWVVRGQKIHRTHLCIFRTGELPDILKPMYSYGGVSIPQRIYERVYAAERTANEAPQLAMTKRLNVQKTDLANAFAKPDQMQAYMEQFAYWRDNYGTKLIDNEDDLVQFDTSLADLDAVIMSQYQIVASAAGVPVTKLFGTSPKGFNATGEYDAKSYHEELETIQANDLTDFVNRHHLLVMRSDVEPALGLAAGAVRVEVDWNPVDSPSAKEYAEINKINADTDAVLVGVGAIDAMDVRERLREDSNSGYTDLEELDGPGVPEGDPDDMESLINGAIEAAQGPALPDA